MYFNTDYSFKKKILEHQISISEWFLKVYVTLKIGVMADENSALSLEKKSNI